MMITVIGGTPNQRKYIETLCEFCIKTLTPRIRTFDITVKLKRLHDAMGYCLELEDNRTFEIEIDRKLTMRKMLETVAHEMVHVKQYARKELNSDHDLWLGKTVNPTKVDYWDLPWEIEANGREAGLFIRWAREQKLNKRKWVRK